MGENMVTKNEHWTAPVLRQRVAVSARPEVVWEVLADVEGWPRWTPTIRTVRALDASKLGLGQRFALRQPFQRERIWYVTTFKDGRSFIWETDGPHGFEAGHIVDGSGESCYVTAWLRPKGAIRLVWPLLKPLFEYALSREAAGLMRVLTAPHSQEVS